MIFVELMLIMNNMMPCLELRIESIYLSYMGVNKHLLNVIGSSFKFTCRHLLKYRQDEAVPFNQIKGDL